MDDDGATDSAIVNLKITPLANRAPEADFTFSPSDPTDRDTVRFTDYSIDTDGDIVLYEWVFGDGNTSTIQNPDHRYGDNGTYTVSLKVTDNGGATDIASRDISIKNVKPFPDFKFTPQSQVKVGTVLNFKDNSTDLDGIILNWTWDFGDGIIAYGNKTEHSYTNAGIYSVTLWITDDDGELSNYTMILTVDEELKNTPGFEIALFFGGIIAMILLKKKKSH